MIFISVLPIKREITFNVNLQKVWNIDTSFLFDSISHYLLDLRLNNFFFPSQVNILLPFKSLFTYNSRHY